jgi:DNA polymerase III epsilon subunit family exonuclease
VLAGANEQKQLLSETEFVAFDLETTGLSPRACRILEFGAVRFRLDGTEIDRFEQLVNPGCPIPSGATRIHGITDRMVRGMPPLAESLPRFLDFLGGSNAILMAHNARFDLGFLRVALAQEDLPPPGNRVVDSLHLARTCIRGFSSYRLEALAVGLGVAEGEDHRAFSDSRLVMGVFQALVRCVQRLETVGDLVRLSPPLSFTPFADL